jgi:hypothetical protein
MTGGLKFFLAILLFFPVIYTYPFLLNMLVRSCSYAMVSIIIILYLLLLALSVFLLSRGYWILFFLLPCVAHGVGVARFRKEFVIKVRKSIDDMRDLFGLGR